MSPHLTKKHHTVAIVIICCLIGVFGISLFTRQGNLQSKQLMPHTQKMLANHVKVSFVTHRGRLLKTYYWSTSHSQGRDTDVTDIFNSDIIEPNSGINNHIPLDYQFDQTDLKNIKTLRNVRLGSAITLVVAKIDPAERPTGFSRLIKWLVSG